MRLPCGVEFVKKDTWATDPRTGRKKRRASVTKNELFRKMPGECHGKFRFDYVLADSWFASVENMAGRSGTSFLNLLTSWNGSDTDAILEEDQGSFTMPSSGVVYFYGRHDDVINVSETYFNIDNSQNIFYDFSGGMSEGYSIQQ